MADSYESIYTGSEIDSKLGFLPVTVQDFTIKQQTLTNSTITNTFTTNGAGVIIVFAGNCSDTTNSYGTWQTRVTYDGTVVWDTGTRLTAGINQRLGSCLSCPIAVESNKTISIYQQNSKGGKIDIFVRFLCFNCSITKNS